MKNRLLIVFAILILSSSNCFAEDVPKIIEDGMVAYKTAGADAALTTWLKGSPLENEKTTISSMKAAIVQIESMCGKKTGHEILKSIRVGSVTIRTYAVIHYERCPLYIKIDSYQTPKGWIIPSMFYHSEAERILPKSMLR